jgi:hypothetical protein
VAARSEAAEPGRWAHTHLMTIGESCRTIERATLGKILAWAIERA